jgi:cell division protein FtsL
MEIGMTDWADGIEIQNNGIKCVIDSRVLSELLRTIISLGLIASALLFYSWVRSQIVNTGYETQRLSSVEKKLRNIQDNLIAEEETLKSPKRIYEIATRDLGMTKLLPSQMILPPIQPLDGGAADSLAMTVSGEDNLKNAEKRERFGTFLIN